MILLHDPILWGQYCSQSHITVANKPKGASFPVFNVAVCVLCLFGNDDIFHIDVEFDFDILGLIFASSQKYVE